MKTLILPGIGSTASVPKVLGENKSQNQFSTIFKTFLSDVLKPFYTGLMSPWLHEGQDMHLAVLLMVE